MAATRAGRITERMQNRTTAATVIVRRAGREIMGRAKTDKSIVTRTGRKAILEIQRSATVCPKGTARAHRVIRTAMRHVQMVRTRTTARAVRPLQERAPALRERPLRHLGQMRRAARGNHLVRKPAASSLPPPPQSICTQPA